MYLEEFSILEIIFDLLESNQFWLPTKKGEDINVNSIVLMKILISKDFLPEKYYRRIFELYIECLDKDFSNARIVMLSNFVEIM